MIQKIDTPVSVALVFNHNLNKVAPKWLIWQNRKYEILKIGLHHTFREGRTLYHVFSVETKNLFFRLSLDTDSLFWRLQEIADGEI